MEQQINQNQSQFNLDNKWKFTPIGILVIIILIVLGSIFVFWQNSQKTLPEFSEEVIKNLKNELIEKKSNSIQHGNIKMKFSVKPYDYCGSYMGLGTSISDINAQWLDDKILKIEGCVSVGYLNKIKNGDFEIQGKNLILKFNIDYKKPAYEEAVCLSCLSYYNIIYKFHELEKKDYNIVIKMGETRIYGKELETMRIQSTAKTVEDCRKISNLEDRIDCLLTLSDKNQDEKICLLPEIEKRHRAEVCAGALINKMNKYEECKKFKTETFAQDCYYRFGVSIQTKENSGACDFLKNHKDRDHCYIENAGYINCEKVTNISNIRDACYSRKSRMICSENIKLRKKCSLEFCKKIIDNYESSQCIQLLNYWIESNHL